MRLNELSLFTGAGGGVLASKLLGWKTIGYVEYEKYCQQVIEQRIKDKIFDNAPIFSDIRAFISEGYAHSYKGMVDVISAGFPCQPFSVAGKQAGAGDPRNMWPQTLECIRIVQPRFCFLENVPALVTSGYFGTVLSGLVESGYDCRWRILSAAEVGAPHKRDRLWIVGHAKHYGQPAEQKLRGNEKASYKRGKKEQATTRKPKGADRPVDVPGIQGRSGGKQFNQNNVAHAETMRRRGGDSKGCDNGERQFLQEEQKGGALGGEAQGCSEPRADMADPGGE